jgi:hypothetical protein|tara:strand:- start:551 stop:946 length:396 start_codon:yes stop_codon:yes gene_type:complete
MSNKIRFYPFKSEQDKHGVRFIPYDATKFELKAAEDNFNTTAVFNQLKVNTEGYVPTYNSSKTYTENLQDLQAKLGYWPAPLSHKLVYEDIPIEYDDEWTEETSQPNFKHRWEMDEHKDSYFPPKDDEVPF